MAFKNNIYYIFFLSLLFHIGIIFFIKGLNISNVTIVPNNNSVVIDLQSSETNIEQTAPNLTIPQPEKFYKPLKNLQKNNFENIKIPDISKIKTVNKENIVSDITNIPTNIPLSYKPIVKNSKVKHFTTNTLGKKYKKIKNSNKVSDFNLIKSYLAIVRKKIEENKKYPILARKMGIEGVVDLKFTIKKMGLISNIKILKSSGSTILDKAAIYAIKSTVPFPKIPDKLNLKKITLKISLIFKLD